MNENTRPLKEEDFSEVDISYVRMLTKAQDDLTLWAKQRFWFIAILASLTGGLGIYALVQETLKSMLDKPVSEAVSKIDSRVDAKISDLEKILENERTKFSDMRQQVNDQLDVLKLASQKANDATERTLSSLSGTQSAIDDKSRELKKLDEQITQIEYNAHGNIRDNALIDARNTFELSSDNNVERNILSTRQKYTDQRIALLDQFILDSVGKDNHPIGSDALVSLRQNDDALKARSDKEVLHLVENAKIKVIFYIKDHEGLLEQTQRASAKLKALGYRSDVWLAGGDNADAAREDIDRDFHGFQAASGAARRGIIVAPSRAGHADEIHTALSAFPLWDDLATAEVELKPERIHLERASGATYKPDDLILVYLLSDPN